MTGFQTGFPYTPLIFHWSGKQIAPPPKSSYLYGVLVYWAGLDSQTKRPTVFTLFVRISLQIS